MSGYQGLKLALPQIGNEGNWGAAINRNFNLINIEINNIYQRLQSFQSVLGAQIPYIRVDERKYFVTIQQIVGAEDELYRLIYWKKPQSYIEEEELETSEDNIHTYKKQADGSLIWSPSIDNYLAAYVLKTCKVTKNDDNTYTETDERADLSAADVFGKIDYFRGDLMVRAQTFGSIHGDYAVTTFKKYPPMGEYYEPIWTVGQPYKLIFQKQNYVDNFFNKYEHNFTLPSIGMGTFNTYEFENKSGSFDLTINGVKDNNPVTITDGAITFSFTVSKTSGQHLEPHIQWYIKEVKSNPYQPLFIAYEVSSDVNSNSIEYNIKFDVSNTIPGETVKATIYFTHAGGQSSYTPAV